MILRIDHVGVVTNDLATAASGMGLMNMKQIYEGDVDTYGVATSFWQCEGDTTSIELVAPVREDAAVHGHLNRLGPGLNHVAFEVDDIDAELAALQERGAILVDEKPCRGGRPGLRVAFAHLGPSTGLLVELVDYGDRASRSPVDHEVHRHRPGDQPESVGEGLQLRTDQRPDTGRRQRRNSP